MRQNRDRALVLLVVFLASFAIAADRITDLRKTVILVSIDGFRPDYLGSDTSNLNSLAERGVRAKWLIPSFPTKTFPNHYTIATGLYPSHHGIVSNNFTDESGARFSASNREAVKESKWWGGEPIWVTAEKQGMITAVLDWPGSEAVIEGTRPTFWREFDEKLTADERVTKLLPYLDKPAAERPRFLTLYMDEVDIAGHDFGPGSPEVKEAVRKVDSAIGKLLGGLRERGILDQVNIIVVSDHGMAPTSRKRVVVLDDFIDLKTVKVADWGPPVALRAIDGNNVALLQKLQRIPHAKGYSSSGLPARLHYADSPRIQPVMILPDEGWTVTSRDWLDKHPKWQHGGQHGYDNQYKSMRATFIAAGPAFASHATIAPFSNVNVYALLAYVLNLRPAETDGSINNFKDVLVKRGESGVPRPRAPWRKERDQVAVLTR